MDPVPELVARREAILEQMRAIRSMRRGTINEQYLKVSHQGAKTPVLRGPYYVLSRREGEKTVSQRLTSSAALEQAKSDVAAHKRFLVLCREFERLTERLGQLERQAPDLEREKKRRSSPSSKTRK